MKSFSAIILLACSFLGTGWYLLLTAPKHSAEYVPKMIGDYEEYCNEDDYLSKASSWLSLKQKDELADLMDCQGSEDPLDDLLKRDFVAIEQNQSLHEIFAPHKVSFQEVATLTAALGPYLRAKEIAVGDFYRFKLVSVSGMNIIDSFEIRKPDPNRLPITYLAKRKIKDLAQAGFTITLSTPNIIEKTALVEITVKETLFNSFSNVPFGHELMQRVMLVLAWRMRMPEQVIQNDKIKVLVTQNYADNKLLGYGDIEAVIYEQGNHVIKAFYFSSHDKKIVGYYDDEGISLEKELMSSPAKITIATSNQRARFHPVYKSHMRHNGIDFRGAIGTDFYAIGDGNIIEKRFDKNVGHMIRIKHKHGVYSEYFHADSLVQSLKVGQKVKRGQKIGEIGRTGRLCTGPHLHLGLYKLAGEKRKYIELSSLRTVLADLPKLSQKYLNEFGMRTQRVLGLMQPKQPGIHIANKFKNNDELSKN